MKISHARLGVTILLTVTFSSLQLSVNVTLTFTINGMEQFN